MPSDPAPAAVRGPWRTRFAPAPTGRLHLGHVVSALHVWGLARAFGGQVVLRVEDHDRIRSRPEHEADLLDDLDWLGFLPDEGTTADFRAGPLALRQSDNQDRYQAALDRLETEGRVYACVCSRRIIREHLEAHSALEETAQEQRWETPYPGICRDKNVDPGSTAIRRLRLPRREVAFEDLRLGPIRQIPAEQCGDVVLRDRDGHWSYQFAVTVDDFEQGIDGVIRGEDLLESTGRQVQVAEILGRQQPPWYFHHPLVLHPDGRKLSKSAGDSGVAELRREGWSPDRVLGEAAVRCGLLAEAAGAGKSPPVPRLDLANLAGLIRHRYPSTGQKIAAAQAATVGSTDDGVS